MSDRQQEPPPIAPAAGLGDAEVVARVLEGDREAFSVLVSRYQESLYRYATAMVLDYDAAADLVQDAFVRAYVHLDECRHPGAFRAWLAQTLRNRCLDYLKEARRRDMRLMDSDEHVSPDEPADARLVRARLRVELKRALAALPSAQREAFVLRCVERYSYEEIAQMTGSSIGALKMRVSRAREALSTGLAGQNVTDLAFGRL